MKKNYLFGMLALAAMTMVGCSNDEVVNDYSQDNAIQFGTYVGRDASSRAHVIDNNVLAKEGFGVFAYYTGQNNFSTSDTPDFMWNQKVQGKKSGEAPNETYSTTEWEYSPLKYWPNNPGDKVSFFAYAPYQDQTEQNKNITLSGNTAQGAPTVNFTVEGVGSQEDLLWADPVLNVVKNQQNGIDIDDKVHFVFHHALARIGFNVQAMVDLVNPDEDGEEDSDHGKNAENGELDNATTVLIKSVELSGYFAPEGTLTYGNDYKATISGTASNQTYSLTTDNFYQELETVDEVTGQSVTTSEERLNDDESYIMIIPRDAGENNLTIKVVYNVITEDSNLAGRYSNVENTISTSFADLDFEAGKAYNFCLHLGLTSVKLKASVADWAEEETNISVNLPINTIGTTTSNQNKTETESGVEEGTGTASNN